MPDDTSPSETPAAQYAEAIKRFERVDDLWRTLLGDLDSLIHASRRWLDLPSDLRGNLLDRGLAGCIQDAVHGVRRTLDEIFQVHVRVGYTPESFWADVLDFLNRADADLWPEGPEEDVLTIRARSSMEFFRGPDKSVTTHSRGSSMGAPNVAPPRGLDGERLRALERLANMLREGLERRSAQARTAEEQAEAPAGPDLEGEATRAPGPEEGPEDRRDIPHSLDSRAVGLGHEMLAKGEAINVAEIARRLGLGRNRKKLYEQPGFSALVRQDRATKEAAKRRLPRGSKDGATRGMEAWEERDE